MPNNVTIFTEMSALAQKHNAINLSQGFPDFELDNLLGQYLKEGFEQGYNQYAPMAGLSYLQEIIAEQKREKYGRAITGQQNITITPGATYGIYCALASFIQHGDEVVIFEPAYDSYAPNIIQLGGRVVRIPLNKNNFKVNWQLVADTITIQTKCIIINSPHNPTGTVWSEDDFLQLKRITRNTDIRIISDEVYEYLTFDGSAHFSILKDEELSTKSYIIFSFGKMIQATGWKIGYVIAPKKLTDAFRNKHQYIAFSVNSIAQYAIGKFLRNYTQLDQLAPFFEAKRDLMLSEFEKLPLKVPFVSSGSYFQLFSFEGVSELSDREFAKMLTTEVKVAAIPISPFYLNGSDEKLLRFCFAKKDETIRAAAANLHSFFNQ